MLMSEMHPANARAIAKVDEPYLSPRHSAIFMALVVLVLYLPGLNAPFIFDDFLNLVHNPQITTLAPQANSFHESRPVGFLSFALNYAAHGLWPTGFRAVNIGIHILAITILYRLILETLQKVQPSWSQPRTVRIAFLAGILWGVHPLQTAAVTCIVQRFESLMGLCFFLVLYSLLRSTTTTQPMLWRVAAVVAFWLGLGCKEVMAACLPVALLYDRCFLATCWRNVWRERGLVYAGMAASFAWLAWAVSHAYASGANATAGFGLSGITAWEYLRSQPAVIGYYLRLCVWPDVLCLDYGWPVEQSAWKVFGLGGILLGTLLAMAWGAWHNRTWGFLGLSMFLVLAPTSSFMPIADLAFEHRMYVPLAALTIFAALGIDYLLRQRFERGYLGFVVLLAVVALSLRTWVRNRDYLDPELVWRQAIAMNPQHARSHFLLAEHLVRSQRDSEALVEYAAAYDIRPHYIAAYNNAALAQERLHNIEAAQALFQTAVQHAPHDLRLQINFGKMLARHARWSEANKVFTRLHEEHPQDATIATLLEKIETAQTEQAASDTPEKPL